MTSDPTESRTSVPQIQIQSATAVLVSSVTFPYLLVFYNENKGSNI
jgi:hypothetical protein